MSLAHAAIPPRAARSVMWFLSVGRTGHVLDTRPGPVFHTVHRWARTAMLRRRREASQAAERVDECVGYQVGQVVEDNCSALPAAHAGAAYLLSVQLRRVTRDVLDLEVRSCPGWTLRTLVNHVVGGAERYALLMEGAPPAAVEATRDRDYSAADWGRRQPQLDMRLIAAFTRCPPGARLPHRGGPVGRTEILRMRLLECLIHAWDVADTVGGPLQLDDELCQFALDECAGTLARLAEHGFYSPADSSQDQTARARLLSAAGRHHDRLARLSRRSVTAAEGDMT